jgi:hypothetical protein
VKAEGMGYTNVSVTTLRTAPIYSASTHVYEPYSNAVLVEKPKAAEAYSETKLASQIPPAMQTAISTKMNNQPPRKNFQTPCTSHTSPTPTRTISQGGRYPKRTKSRKG